MLDFKEKMEEKENFIIVDANAFVHSSFHGYSPCLDCKGIDNRVLQGLMNAIVDLSYNLPKIDYLYMVFDPPDGSLYRKSVFPAYKANRPPTDPDLTLQKDRAIKILAEHIGIPMVSIPGYEADDIIGSMAYSLKDNYNVTIVSPDKDLAQLVQPNVRLMRRYRTKEKRGYKFLDEEAVYQNFGVYPKQIPDWLSLMGDAADNLPGLYKVGEKTAADLLKKYISLEHLIAIHHEMDNQKLKEKIKEALDTLPIIKHLATIKCDLLVEEKIQEALDKAHAIRTHQEYSNKFNKVKNYFNWPEHYVDMFLTSSPP